MSKKIMIFLFLILLLFFIGEGYASGEAKSIADIENSTFGLLLQEDITKEEMEAFENELMEYMKSTDSEERQKLLDSVADLVTSVETVISSLWAEALTDGLKDPNAPSIDSNKKRIERLRQVKSSLQIVRIRLSEKLPLDKGWVEEFSTNFYLGYEGTSVSGIKEKGTARTEIMIYNQISGPLEKSGDWGFHVFGNILLTSSAEQSTEDENQEPSIEQAIEVDLNLYVPWGCKIQSYGLLAVGPIGGAAIRKIDDVDKFSKKYLGGLRFAHSPESFFDVLYAKTQNVEGDRVEIRGQIPVAEMLNGRIFIGGSLNFSTGSEGQESDNVRMYIAWQVDFSNIFAID
ncbi:MAG: hypothetical protein ACMUIM_00330 [bacterium]